MDLKYDFYRLRTGRIIDDFDLEKAYEIVTGKSPDDNDDFLTYEYQMWRHWIVAENAQKIENPDDSTVKEFVAAGYETKAVQLYRDLHGCTLAEARNYVKTIF